MQIPHQGLIHLVLPMGAMAEELDPHGFRMTFGKHEGKLITRVPPGYLRWMIIQDTRDADMAAAELERRGTVFPQIEITPHAINRASLRCLERWKETREKDEGLHAWLVRLGTEAWELAEGQEKVDHAGIRFVFQTDMAVPILKAVMPSKKTQ